MDRRNFIGGILKASLPTAIAVSAYGTPMGAPKGALNTGTMSFEAKAQRSLVIQLGPEYDVQGINRSYTHFVARIAFEGHVFFLKSPDGKKWHTMDFEPHFSVSKAGV